MIDLDNCNPGVCGMKKKLQHQFFFYNNSIKWLSLRAANVIFNLTIFQPHCSLLSHKTLIIVSQFYILERAIKKLSEDMFVRTISDIISRH